MAESSVPLSGGPALVLLAAGEGRRLGGCKATLELGGRSVLARLLEAGRGLRDEGPALVVSGPHHDALRRALDALGRIPGCPLPELEQNPHWRQGRTGSVQRAVERRPGRDLCLAPVDVPLVSRAVFVALARAWEQAGAPPRGWLAPFVVASTGGRRAFGHPIVMGRELALEVASLAPERPLRELRRSARPLLAVAVLDAAILDDLDRPEDATRLEARLAEPEPPCES